MNEKNMIDQIIDEIGDISGWTVLDLGSGPCTMVTSLVRRIGSGRVFAVDLFMGLLDSLKKTLSKEQLLRTVALKADLRRLDFLKEDFFDLITAYDTLSVIDEYTPGGTPYVLGEAQRILKPNGWFVAVEHWPLEAVKPVDKAQETELRWWKIHIQIAKALGEATGTEYTPNTLQRRLFVAGFVTSHWEKVQGEATEPGIMFGSKIITRAKQIRNKCLRGKIFREMQCIEKDALRYQMRELPRFVVYARKTRRKRVKELEEPSLTELYTSIRRHDLLF